MFGYNVAVITSFLAIIIGKIISFITKTFSIGGGSAAPGLYALKTDSNLIERLSKQIPTNIIITGTNGKTTTARLLNHLLTKQKLKTLRNSTGSNLERGVASSLLSKASIFGEVKDVDVGIWEVDEAAFNTLLPKIKPAVVVFLNSFRDQLDRYGEVDSVVRKWQTSLNQIEQSCVLIVNGDDTNTAKLSAPKACLIEYFGIKGHKIAGEKGVKRTDVVPVIEASKVKLEGLSGSKFDITVPEGTVPISLPLPGNYQIYNFLAAFGVYRSLNMPLEAAFFDLNEYTSAFGRVEEIQFKKNKGIIWLIKNPVGASQVFETVVDELSGREVVLCALNDNLADGQDVSWIWDAEFERFKNQDSKFKIICSGTRANDLAVRFKYAGIDEDRIQVEPNLDLAFDSAFKLSNDKVIILPTYTALLELQKLLAAKKIKKHYWKE